MYRGVSFFAAKNNIFYSKCRASVEVGRLIPVFEVTVTHPSVLDIIKADRIPRVIMNIVFVMDETFRIAVPVTLKLDVLDTNVDDHII